MGCIKYSIYIIFFFVTLNAIHADKDSSFRKKGAIAITATPLFGKEVEGVDRSTNNYLGFKSHNFQYGRYAIDLSYSFIDNLSVGLRYFEVRNQKNKISYPDFPTVPLNPENYSNSYEYELRYRQPAAELFINYFPFSGNDFFITLLSGRTAGTIESYHKNDLMSNSSASKIMTHEYPSSVRVTNDPMMYLGMGIGYRWKILETLLIDASYDFKSPSKRKEYISVNDDLFLLALMPNSGSAIQTIQISSPTLKSVQSFYLRLGIAF
ncbi:hypothetical protein [Leptospira sanjuanensis]|uniref:hypothetical protein n=1 Tax=Leptospira sanjuanensis TaxID=2879643 RepID=UPI001EE96F82|nr:hypothetical protein [Leptospira sanjuanensis]MCG6170273.1 hypothetical protein [Leptospira sanjuanensis]